MNIKHILFREFQEDTNKSIAIPLATNNMFPDFAETGQTYLDKVFVKNTRILYLMSAMLIFSHPNRIYAAENAKASRFYENALVNFHKNDIKAAIIDLKNAIQENPGYLSAHILLGQAYLQDKQLIAAEHELKQAGKMGADKSLIITSLAKLYLSQIKYDQLLKEIDPSQFNAATGAELHLYRGHAHLQINQPAEALKEYEASARLNPRQVEAMLGKANALLRQGDVAEAGQIVKQVISTAPENADVWYVQASVNQAKSDLDSALKDYDKAIEFNPDHLDARSARAGILMDLRKYDLAAADLTYLREKYPFDPKAAYLHAVLLKQDNQNEASRKELEAAADILDGIRPELLDQHAQSLMLSGLVNYSLGRFQQATKNLKKYIGQFPDQAGPYKLLASILLADGQAHEAVELLKQGLIYASSDYRFLLMLATAYMQTGNHDKANEMLDKASSLVTNDDNAHIELGASRLAMGQEELAIKEFESSLKNHPENTKAWITLANVYIKRGENAKALSIAKTMHKNAPTDLTLLNLLGSTQILEGQIEQARLSFEKAVSIDQGFIIAHINLSKLDIAEKKFAEARQRLLKLNEKFPEDIIVMVEMARLYQAEKNYDKAITWLENARKLNAKSLPVILALIDVRLESGNYLDALRTAHESLEIFPKNMQLQDALARSYIASGQKDKAISLYSGMTSEVGFDEELLYRISRQQTALEDYHGAIKSLQKAVQGNPDYLPAQIALTEVQLFHGEKIFALNGADSIIERFPDKSIGYRLRGDIDYHTREFAHAVVNYQTAFAKEKNADLLMRLYLALKQANDQPKALQLLEEWVNTHPQDKIPMQALAEEHLRAGQLEKAKKYYELILQDNKNQPKILNNLANIYFVTGDPKALSYAEQAQQLAPEQATVNDTLGWILVNNGQVEKGLEYLRNAYSRSSQNPEIRYHIAVALYKSNRFEEARSELEQVLQEKQSFRGIEDARALMEKLKS
jgi:putative PEP-CTERM system TPR-repeat lipoprotein